MPLFRFENRMLLFVHVPKTAGTSIEALLKLSGGIEALRYSGPVESLPCSPQHFHAELLGQILSPAFYDAGFSVVRNPYDRLLSEYKMRVLASGRAIGFDGWVERVIARYAKNPFCNDNHIRPQSHFLLSGLQLFRFEEQPFVRLRGWLSGLNISCSLDMPWERRGGLLPVPVTMSAATAGMIAAFYATDFRELGYRTDDYGPTLMVAAA